MVRGIGLVQSTEDLENIVVTALKGTPVRVRDLGRAGIGHAIRFGILGRDHDDDLVQGIVLMRKGENPDAVINGVRATIEQLQKSLPAGVVMRPYYSRDRLVRTTVTTVMRNLIEGAALVIVLLSLFLYDLRAAFIVALTIPLSLLFAFVFMDLRGIPANLLSLGAIDFGIIVDGAVIMTENILRHLSERRVTGPHVVREVQHAALEVARPLTFAVMIIMTVYVPILTFQRIEGKLFRPMAVTISLSRPMRSGARPPSARARSCAGCADPTCPPCASACGGRPCPSPSPRGCSCWRCSRSRCSARSSCPSWTRVTSGCA